MARPIELHRFVPYFLSSIANRWTSTSSRLYLREFGIGIAEWRVLASIRSLGQASAMDAANLTAMDPAATTRAMAQLQAKAFVAPVVGRFQGRTKPFALTDEGRSVYDAIRRVALKRESILLEDLTVDEREELLRLLNKLHGRLGQL